MSSEISPAVQARSAAFLTEDARLARRTYVIGLNSSIQPNPNANPHTEVRKDPAFSERLQLLWNKAKTLAAENDEAFSTLHVLQVLQQYDPDIHQLFDQLFTDYGQERRLPAEAFGENAVIPGATLQRFEAALTQGKKKQGSESDISTFRNRLMQGAHFEGRTTIEPWDILEAMTTEHGNEARDVLESVFLLPRMTSIARRAHSLRFQQIQQ